MSDNVNRLRWKARLFRVVVAVLALLLVSPAAQAETANTVEQRVLAEVNRERAAGGLMPLELDARLATGAGAHAADMAARNTVAHEGQDGTTMKGRLKRLGYRYLLAAENVSGGYQTAKAAVRAWMKSAGHRKNILLEDITHAGVGYVHRAKEGAHAYHHYWVLLLARPLPNTASTGKSR